MAQALRTNLIGTLLGSGLITGVSAWLIYTVQAGNTNLAYFSCFMAGVLIIGLGLSNRIALLSKTTYFLVFLVCIGGLTMAFFLETVLKSEAKLQKDVVTVAGVSAMQNYPLAGFFTFQESYTFLTEKSVYATQDDFYFFLVPVVPLAWQPGEEITAFTAFKVRKPTQVVDWQKTQTEYLKNLTAPGTVARLLKNPQHLALAQLALQDFPAAWCRAEKPYLVEMGEVHHPIGYENGLKLGFLLLNGVWLAVSLFYLLRK